MIVAGRARILLEQIEEHGEIAATYPYPVSVWRLGSEFLWVFIGGEPVVDYSLRLKKELEGSSPWIAGYSNDVMAYIPSERVLAEDVDYSRPACLLSGLLFVSVALPGSTHCGHCRTGSQSSGLGARPK